MDRGEEREKAERREERREEKRREERREMIFCKCLATSGTEKISYGFPGS